MQDIVSGVGVGRARSPVLSGGCMSWARSVETPGIRDFSTPNSPHRPTRAMVNVGSLVIDMLSISAYERINKTVVCSQALPSSKVVEKLLRRGWFSIGGWFRYPTLYLRCFYG